MVETGNDSLQDVSSKLQGVEKTIFDDWLGNSSLSPDVRKIATRDVLKTVVYTYETLLETDQDGNLVNSDIHVQIIQAAVQPVVVQVGGCCCVRALGGWLLLHCRDHQPRAG